MGKFGKKAERSSAVGPDRRKKRATLEGQQQDDKVLRDDHAARKLKRQKRNKTGDESESDEEELDVVDEKMSKKIFEQAREQQEEVEEEDGGKFVGTRQSDMFGGDSDDQESNYEDDDLDYEDPLEAEEITLDDEKAMQMFMGGNPFQNRNLADMIMEKIREKEDGVSTAGGMEGPPAMDPKIIEVYTGVGKLLRKYKSGKLPKAFKVIPALSNWEDILLMTNPDAWSAQATFQGTRLFASNLNAKMAQRFFNLVLLPRVRDDIAEFGKLNVHLYSSLKKALYKPAAFVKGILIPLCEARNCSLREAVIFASVLAKVSIPMLHSAVALLKLCEMEYSGANSYFIRILLNKKYALPYKVLDSVVGHYLSFMNDTRELPILWHQSLLCFVQRYKEEITVEEKESLKLLMRKQFHEQVTPEIRRELFDSRSRGEPVEAEMEVV